MEDKYKIFYDKVGETYEDWYQKMYKTYSWAAYKYVKQDDVHDIVTESMINVIKYIYSYDPTRSKISTWGWKIVHNTIIRKYQIKKFKNEFYYQDYDIDGNKYDSYSFQIPWDSGEYEKEREEEIQKNYKIMISCISKIPKMYSEILIAREIRGLDYQEIADEFNLNLSTTKNRIKKARVLLIKKYTAYKTIKK